MALSTSRTVVTNTGLSTHHHFRVRDLLSVGVATFSNFKTGSTNIHSVGVEAAGINVLGADTPIGTGSTIYNDGGARFSGIVTATSFVGSGANLTGIDATAIQTGTTKIQTSATLISNQISGSGIATVQAGGLDVTGVVTATTFSGSGANLTSLPAANITGTLPAISGANLTNLDASDLASGTVPTARLGSGTASSSTFLRGDSTIAAVTSTTINNNANNRIITGSGTANTLEGESTLTYNGTQLHVNGGAGSNVQVDGTGSYGQFSLVKVWMGLNSRSHNTAVGNGALASATGGQDCTAVGHNALNNSTSGSANTVFGSHAMIGTVTGSNNVAVGHGALNKLTSGYNNTAVGRLAGLENLGGHNNTFFGLEAGTNNTSGSSNIYGGSGAGKYETTSTDNVAIGWNCFGGERSGGNSNQFNKNVCIGHQALASQRIANGDGENVVLGYRAMYSASTGGWRNCIVGFKAGYTQNGASYNTFLGTFAGYNYTSGGNTMCLGYNAGTASSPSGALTTNQDTICLGNNSISQFYCNDTSISSSDSRDKTDITEWTHGLSFINQLKPITYRWDKRTWYGTDEEPIGTPDGSKKRARLHLGFLAQDALAVEQSFGYASKKDDMLAVNLNEDGSAYGMKYERLVVPLTKAVQELSAKVETPEAKVAALEGS